MLYGKFTQFEYFHMMGPVIHPGEILREAIQAAGISQAILARRIGSTDYNISRIVRGHALYGEEYALRLESALPETSAEFWMAMRSRWALKEAREKSAQEAKNA